MLFATVLAALMGTTQALSGLLPYYSVTQKILDTDFFDVSFRVKSYNGWRHVITNDQTTLTSKWEILSDNKFRTQFEFFNFYMYQITTSVSPINVTPVKMVVSYQAKKPYALTVVGTSTAQFGKLTTTVKQLNKAYTGSFIDPLFDENTKIEDYVFGYQDISYYTKKIVGEGGVDQTGYWNWDPLANKAISQSWFSWDVLHMS
uniref:Uncharacterized protein n=1 Tax=Oxytricha trifallax TaxID=94289 RepID=A7Y485_OXYTR|nr:hypothetical protein [Sterkiella histriomuscorum]